MGMYLQTNNQMGFIDPATATLVATQAGGLLKSIIGGDPRKGRDTQRENEFNAFLASVVQRMNQGNVSASEAQQFIAQGDQFALEIQSSFERAESRAAWDRAGGPGDTWRKVKEGTSAARYPQNKLGLLAIAGGSGGGIFSQLLPGGGGTDTSAGSLLPWGIAAAGLYFLS